MNALHINRFTGEEYNTPISTKVGDYWRKHIPFYGLNLNKLDYIPTDRHLVVYGADEVIYGNYNYNLYMQSYTTGYYVDLFINIRNKNVFKTHVFRDITYMSCCYFLCSVKDNSYDIIFTLVVKNEFIPYVKACYIFNEPVDTCVFEFWVKKGFDTKDTTYRRLRPRYRKEIKPLILDYGIPIIEKDNIYDELYNSINLPEFKTISDSKEWLNKLTSEALVNLKEKYATQIEEINIIDEEEDEDYSDDDLYEPSEEEIAASPLLNISTANNMVVTSNSIPYGAYLTTTTQPTTGRGIMEHIRNNSPSSWNGTTVNANVPTAVIPDNAFAQPPSPPEVINIDYSNLPF